MKKNCLYTGVYSVDDPSYPSVTRHFAADLVGVCVASIVLLSSDFDTDMSPRVLLRDEREWTDAKISRTWIRCLEPNAAFISHCEGRGKVSFPFHHAQNSVVGGFSILGHFSFFFTVLSLLCKEDRSDLVAV